MTEHLTGGQPAEPAHIIVLGRPGSGKGTQSALLSEALGLPHVSTGDLLRTEVARGGRAGREIAGWVERGELVPDPLVMEVLFGRLARDDVRTRGFLLDGFPRSATQAAELERSIAPARIDGAVELMVSEREAAQRLLARFVCADCGRSPYGHADGAAPVRAMRCAACGGVLRRRTDDATAAIARRFDEFERLTKPLLAWLDRRGLLVTVDAERPPADVAASLLAALEPIVDPPSRAEPEFSA
ncbi:MAG: nucleoside monophosphate kinase [Acidimicrobiia bacterium]|jgi:adenylate kinase